MSTWISSIPMDSCFSYPSQIYPPNQDLAIRMFCTARQEQDPLVSGREQTDAVLDMATWPSPFPDNTPSSDPREEELSIVDSFMNVATAEEAGLGIQEAAAEHAFAIDHPPLRVLLGNVDKGLELVHLLLACAEAVGCRDANIASSTLGHVWALSSPYGDPLQRVSYYFALGLKTRLSLLHSVGFHGSLDSAVVAPTASLWTREERVEAFHLLHQNTPYVAFGFMAANEAICQAAQGRDSLHVVDLGMEHCLQWPSLVRMLATRPGGPPAVLRITGVGVGANHVELEASMDALVREASVLGVQMEFHAMEEAPSPEVLIASKLGLRPGEALFVNSAMHLHKHVKDSRGSLKAVLIAVRRLSPALLTMVEQDANHNGPFFLSRFVESLHYYAAVFDSLEARLPRGSAHRAKVEGRHFGEEIVNLVAYEGPRRVERHERADQWRRQLGRAGFQVAAMGSMSQARMLLSVYGCDGYTLACEKGCLLLGWRGRPMILASAWRLPGAAAAAAASSSSS